MLRGLRTISALSTAARNETGSSNGASLSAPVPMPAGTWASEPAPRRSAVLAGEVLGAAVVALEPEAGVGGLEHVDGARVLVAARTRAGVAWKRSNGCGT